jgi:CheY-like chemotaxis protein
MAPSAHSGAKPRVLIVEDNDDAREMYARWMRGSGWRVDAVGNGLEALVAAKDGPPDVIVMDLELPVLDGIAATRLLKADDRSARIPVVACTAFASRLHEQIRDAGFDLLVRKPCARAYPSWRARRSRAGSTNRYATRDSICSCGSRARRPIWRTPSNGSWPIGAAESPAAAVHRAHEPTDRVVSPRVAPGRAAAPSIAAAQGPTTSRTPRRASSRATAHVRRPCASHAATFTRA